VPDLDGQAADRVHRPVTHIEILYGEGRSAHRPTSGL
jgi:hypothetical protein